MATVREQGWDWPEGWSLGGAVNAGDVGVGAEAGGPPAQPRELLIQPEAFARLAPE